MVDTAVAGGATAPTLTPVTTRLADLTTLRLGGPAARFVVAADEGDVVDAVLEADGAGEPLLVLAGGSNVVVADEGFPGVVVHVATRGIDRREEEGKVVLTVQAGEPWDPFVAFCVEHDLAGVEALSGIPGSVGATPIQNVGAYGQEVAETIDSVLVLDRERKVVQLLDVRAAEFSYRSSAFKRTPNRWVVLAVTFALDPDPLSRPIRYPELARELGVEVGERAPLAAVREAVLALRRRKGMVVDDADPGGNLVLIASAAPLRLTGVDFGRGGRFTGGVPFAGDAEVLTDGHAPTDQLLSR